MVSRSISWNNRKRLHRLRWAEPLAQSSQDWWQGDSNQRYSASESWNILLHHQGCKISQGYIYIYKPKRLANKVWTALHIEELKWQANGKNHSETNLLAANWNESHDTKLQHWRVATHSSRWNSTKFYSFCCFLLILPVHLAKKIVPRFLISCDLSHWGSAMEQRRSGNIAHWSSDKFGDSHIELI